MESCSIISANDTQNDIKPINSVSELNDIIETIQHMNKKEQKYYIQNVLNFENIFKETGLNIYPKHFLVDFKLVLDDDVINIVKGSNLNTLRYILCRDFSIAVCSDINVDRMKCSIKMPYSKCYNTFKVHELVEMLNSNDFQSYINKNYTNIFEEKKCFSKIKSYFDISQNLTKFINSNNS